MSVAVVRHSTDSARDSASTRTSPRDWDIPVIVQRISPPLMTAADRICGPSPEIEEHMEPA